MGPAPVTHVTNLDHNCLVDLAATLIVQLVELLLHLLYGLLAFLLCGIWLLLGLFLLIFLLLSLISLTGVNVNIDLTDICVVNIRNVVFTGCINIGGLKLRALVIVHLLSLPLELLSQILLLL